MQWLQSLTRVVNNLGRNGTAPPQSSSNMFPLVWDYMLSRKLVELAERKKKEAHQALLDAQLVPAEPKQGTHVLFNADGLSLILRRNADSTTLDEAALRNELSRRFGVDVMEEIMNKCRKPRRGATIVEAAYEQQ